MRINMAGAAQSVAGKALLAGAIVATAIGACAGLTSCASSSKNGSVEHTYPFDEFVAGSSDRKLKEEALNMANNDPDIQYGCLGYPINLLRNDTYHCNDGRIIHWDVETAIKDETRPDGTYKSSLFEDIAKTNSSNNYKRSQHDQIAERD